MKTHFHPPGPRARHRRLPWPSPPAGRQRCGSGNDAVQRRRQRRLRRRRRSPAPSPAAAPPRRRRPRAPGPPASRRPTPTSPSTTTRSAPAAAARTSSPAPSPSPAPTPTSPTTRASCRGDQERCGGTDAIEVPSYVSPIAVVYNLDGVDDLQPLAGHAGRDLRRHDHDLGRPGHRRRQPRRRPAGSAINAVHRSDESGTTENFTDYLDRRRPRRLGRRRDRDLADRVRRRGRQGHLRRRAAGEQRQRTPSATPTPARPATSASRRSGRRRVRRALRRGRRQDPRGLAAGRGRAPTSTSSSTSTTPRTRRATYPIVLTSYLIACQTYDDAGDRRRWSRATWPTSSATRARQAAAEAGSAPLASDLRQGGAGHRRADHAASDLDAVLHARSSGDGRDPARSRAHRTGAVPATHPRPPEVRDVSHRAARRAGRRPSDRRRGASATGLHGPVHRRRPGDPAWPSPAWSSSSCIEGVPGADGQPATRPTARTTSSWATSGRCCSAPCWPRCIAMSSPRRFAIGVALVISHYAPAPDRQDPVAYLIDLLAAVPSVVYGLWGIGFLAPHAAAGLRSGSTTTWRSSRSSPGRVHRPAARCSPPASCWRSWPCRSSPRSAARSSPRPRACTRRPRSPWAPPAGR